MRISVEINKSLLREATIALEGIRGGIHRAVEGAVGETLRSVKSGVSKELRERINIKKKKLDPLIQIKRRSKISGAVILFETKRIPLKYFGAKQKAEGVSYQIQKKGGRKTIRSAFGPKIPRLGRHVFRRIGKKRLPIAGPLKGPSPWGVFVKNELGRETQEKANVRLQREVEDRVVFLVKKANGLI